MTSPRWISKFQIKPDSWVFVPNEETVEYGRDLKTHLENLWQTPDFYFHLKLGGHVRALKIHEKNIYFIHLDIKNFFGKINRSRVTRCMKCFFDYDKAREVANLSTVILPNSEPKKYILPFGFVQSPIIASICLQKSKLGNWLNQLHLDPLVTVSVYMDDIIISANDNGMLLSILQQLTGVAEKSGFAFNEKKIEGPAELITAFNIELSYRKLKINEERYMQFKEAYRASENMDELYGILGYVSSINAKQADEITEWR